MMRRAGPVFVLVLTTVGCRAKPAIAPVPETPANVLIVIVDTLRADHMSTFGYERPTTPFIDRFAMDAVVFERARAQASCTFPSVNSIMTSRYPGGLHESGRGPARDSGRVSGNR